MVMRTMEMITVEAMVMLTLVTKMVEAMEM